MRLDQWLWAVRAHKTRTLAVEAIKAGQVEIGGVPTKPAREVHPGEIVTVQTGPLLRTLKVIGAPAARVGAPLVPRYAEDLTPPEEHAKAREQAVLSRSLRPKGSGRPTKRDRRAFDQLHL